MNKEEVKKIRESAGWTREQMADFLGVRVTTVYRWESGLRKVRGPVKKLLRMVEK